MDSDLYSPNENRISLDIFGLRPDWKNNLAVSLFRGLVQTKKKNNTKKEKLFQSKYILPSANRVTYHLSCILFSHIEFGDHIFLSVRTTGKKNHARIFISILSRTNHNLILGFGIVIIMYAEKSVNTNISQSRKTLVRSSNL